MIIALLSIGCGGKAKKDPKVVTGVAELNDRAGAASSKTKNTASDSSSSDAEGDGTNIALQPVVYFDFDSTSLNDDAKKKLVENATWLKEDQARMLTIEGHTDETGTTDYNLALGERRARETRDFLLRLGVDGKRVSIITYGEERPASDDDNQNRRSMFIATKP